MKNTKVKDQFIEYLEQLGYHPKSIYKKHNYHVVEFLDFIEKHGLVKMEEVEVKHVLCYRDYLQERPNKVRAGKLSEIAVYNKLRTVELLFEMLEFKGEIKGNPLSEIEIKAPKRQQRKIIVTEVEINGLYEVCRDQKERSLLSLGYGCGLRVGEIERLNVSDLNFDNGYLIVQKGKGNKRRLVPMSTGVIKDLKKYYQRERIQLRSGRDYEEEAEAFLLNKRGGRMKQWTFNKTLKALIIWTKNEELKNKKIGMHHLRHSIATHLLHRGLDVQQVRQFLGHVLLSTTEIYTHVHQSQILKL
jgi:integrase/recombinase XerD